MRFSLRWTLHFVFLVLLAILMLNYLLMAYYDWLGYTITGSRRFILVLLDLSAALGVGLLGYHKQRNYR